MSIIQVEAVTKRYQKRKYKEVVTAVQEVSFNVAKGEILGLLGPNGAGKTTTIKTICGFVKNLCVRLLLRLRIEDEILHFASASFRMTK